MWLERLTGLRARAGHACLLWLAGSYLAVAVAASPASTALTLPSAMTLALDRAPLLDADAARTAAAASDLDQAEALPDPQLVLGLDNLAITGPNAGSLSGDDMTMRRIGISQEWPGRAKRRARGDQAQARYAETVVAQTATRLSVERAAGNAWVACWAAEQRVALLEQMHEELVRAVSIAQAHLRGGEGSASDVLLARSARADHENDMSIATAELQAARISLRRWIGADASTALTPAPNFDNLPISAQALRESTGRQAVGQLWAARQRSAETAVQLARAEQRPDLNLGLSYGARSGGRSDMLSVEVGVGLPFFARRRHELDIAARRAEADAISAEATDAQRAQAEALERELSLWQGQAEVIARYRQTLLPLARDRVRVALAAYSGGGTIEPWLLARQEAVDTQLKYSKAQAEQATRWVLLATLLPGDSHE